jgi:hypothetical protein
MKIEKTPRLKCTVNDPVFVGDLNPILDIIDQIIDAHNAKEPNDGKVVDLDDATLEAVLNKEPEKVVMADKATQPKEESNPEPKPLRDGDCFWDHFNNGPHLLYTEFPPSSWRCSLADHFKLNPDNPIIFNILDLAAAVQRGEKVVTLTHDEICILEQVIKCEMSCRCYEPRLLAIDSKLRAAMGGGQ